MNPQQPGMQGQISAYSKAVPAVNLVTLGTLKQDWLQAKTAAGLHMYVCVCMYV